jgi:putative ABC transport system permease protein
MSLDAADTFFEQGGEYTGIYVITKDPEHNDKVEKEIRDRFGKNIGVTTPKAIAETIQSILSTFNAFISSIASVSMFVGAVGIVTTLFTAVIERTKEIGLLKALGFNSLTVLLMFLTESVTIGVVGGMLGVLMGIGGAYLLIRVMPFNFSGGWIRPVFIPSDLIYVAILSLVLSCVAGLYPAWRASRLSPLIALRKE